MRASAVRAVFGLPLPVLHFVANPRTLVRLCINNWSGTMCCKCYSLAKIPDPSCSCGAAKQTMSHTVNDCPLSRFPGSLTTLHLAGDEANQVAGHAVQTIRRKRLYGT